MGYVLSIRDIKLFEMMETGNYENYDENHLEPVRKISSLFQNAEEKEFKTYLAINYVEHLSWGGNYSHYLKDIDTSIINFITNNFPLNYFNLNGQFISLCGIESDLINEDLLSNKRFQNYLESIDKTDGEYARLQSDLVDFYMKKKDTTTARIFYSALKTDFPDHSSTANATNRYNLDGDKKIVVGNIIPDFELPNLDNPDEMISMQKLRGKWVLLDVWHQHCGPCIAEIPNMQKVYEKYKSKNFEIYSISFDKPDKIKEFKSREKYQMPWLHSYSGDEGFRSEVARLLETLGVPHYILVAPDGKIAELNKLRGTNLDATLEELLMK